MSSRSKKKWKNKMRAGMPLPVEAGFENLQEADSPADETIANEKITTGSSEWKNDEIQQNLIPEKKNEDIVELEKKIFEPKVISDTLTATEILENNEAVENSIAASTEGIAEPLPEAPPPALDTKTISSDALPKKKVSATERTVRVERITKETEIVLELNLDGTGKAKIDTGIGFFDHMLVSMAKHGFLDMKLTVHGDLFVDGHHTIEDTGIVFGQALKKALGAKEGIKRYGSFLLPMDETLVLCAVDLSGRPYLNFSAKFTTERVGYMETELVREFFYAVSYSAGMNLHMKVMDGQNNHHIIEAMFKAFAKALDEAKTVDPRIFGVLSTKGVV